MTDIKFSTRIVAGDDAGLSDAELEKYSGAISRWIDAEFQRVTGFPWPEMPKTIEYQKPPACGCYVIHLGNCRYFCA